MTSSTHKHSQWWRAPLRRVSYYPPLKDAVQRLLLSSSLTMHWLSVCGADRYCRSAELPSQHIPDSWCRTDVLTSSISMWLSIYPETFLVVSHVAYLPCHQHREDTVLIQNSSLCVAHCLTKNILHTSVIPLQQCCCPTFCCFMWHKNEGGSASAAWF